MSSTDVSAAAASAESMANPEVELQQANTSTTTPAENTRQPSVVQSVVSTHTDVAPALRRDKSDYQSKSQIIAQAAGANLGQFQKLHKDLWKDLPSVTITYRDLAYTYQVPSTDLRIPTLHSSFFDFFLLRKWTTKTIPFAALQPSTGVVRPGTMTLILAPPGHGKSSLLQSLAGRYFDKRQSGVIKYNGQTAAECAKQGIHVNKLTAFVNQGETHNALMTVHETFKFALENAVADPALLNSPEFMQAAAQKVDFMIDLLGLREAANTILGNALVRGVSGGQRRRVTLGEMMITDARALFLDEITTGLDSSTSFDILGALRRWTRLMDGSVVTALLQPTPECFALFDNLILMRHGTILYDGPLNEIENYLTSIGIPVPDDQDLGDFLSDFLTDPSMVYYRTQYRAARKAGQLLDAVSTTGVVEQPEAKEQTAVTITTGSESPTEHDRAAVMDGGLSSDKASQVLKLAQSVAPPLSTSALKAAYVNSKYYAQNLADISLLEKQSASVFNVSQWSAYTRAQFGAPYSRSYWTHLDLNFKRSADNLRRNASFFMPRIFQAVFMGFILGGLFYQTDPSNFQAKLGLIIFAIVNGAFANASEVPFAAEGKNVVFKQVDAGFFPTSSYALSTIITNLPVSIVESTVMTIIIYWMVGFATDAGRFFFFLLINWSVNIACSVLFRGITWGTQSDEIANQIAPPLVATMFLSAGYLILYNSFPRWLIWLYELSPFTWALRSLAINEFFDDRYSAPSTVPGFEGMTTGEAYLRSWDIDPTWAYKWAGFGYIVGFFLIFAYISSLILSYARYPLTIGTRRFADEEEAADKSEDDQARLQAATDKVGSTGATVQPQGESDAQYRERARAAAMKYASSFKLQTAATALPFVPVDLAWKDIHYTVQVEVDGKKVDRKLLSGIDGFASAGTLTALMGSSGAGKTTLMDVIAGRKTAGKIDGKILVNGYDKVTATFNRLCGYVEQTDNHTATMTVRESLLFSAKLRLPRSVTSEQRHKFVEEILDILELTPIAERLIGDESAPGLSPGQLKRVTIGVELASNPSVLFLDEPTSGLDSRAALIVMRVVKRISKTGRSVLCTIHQPSQELFFLFDRLLLLKSGGQTVYFGPVGQDGVDLVNYFEQAPVPTGVRKPRKPKTTNPASWMLDVIGAGTVDRGNEPQADYLEIYNNSQMKRTAQTELEPLLKPNPERPELTFDNMYATSYMTQYMELQKRTFTAYYRSPGFVWIRQGLMVFLACLLGFLYLQVGESTAQSAITKLSAVFVGMVFPGWTICMSSLTLVMRWRTVFYREQSSRMYTPFVYALSLSIVEIFYTCWSAIVFLALYYPMVGFPNNADSFFRYFAVQYVIMYCWISLGHFVAAGLPNIMVGNIIASLLGTFSLLFSGIFRLAFSMPAGWKWIYYMNPIPKALIALTNVAFQCDGDCPVYHNQIGPDGSSWNDITSYDYVLRYQGATTWYAPWIGYLILTIVVLRIFFFLCVSRVNYMKR